MAAACSTNSSLMCRDQAAERLWLEVRQSNQRAQRLYERYGFRFIGVRRGYYPALQGRREDASVMSLDTLERHDALE